ncbi:MAG: 6-carboxytetrahydropterin synthase QueD [Desulfobacteraceae bacterium]|nr:6-carboxytetrahydropterin synthase QueD [Desulfobacteraceae bacterium]MCK5543175.1 6-carboxytetrahydropterin synthase QueD [Desulfobacterales bacterium]
MFELKIKNNFSAAHKLVMVGEKCENLHGHNWHIEARVIGEKLNPAGVLVDFGNIKKFVNEIMKELDHKYLNEIEIFNDEQPTSERIAVYIAQRLQMFLDELDEDVKVSSVTAWESEDASATYFL